MKTTDHPRYLQSVSPEYLEQLKELYDSDPSQLPPSWRIFFDGAEFASTEAPGASVTETGGDSATTAINIELQLLDLIEAYRQRGHLYAHLNPLEEPHSNKTSELSPSRFGLDKVDKNYRFQGAKHLGIGPSTLQQIIDHLEATYCSTLGVEYMHISDEKARKWLESKMEPVRNRAQYNGDQKKTFLSDLVQGTYFENFLQKKFTGQKRFSLEGAESIIPAIKQMVRSLASQDVREIVIGMAHRGRLNVLVNILKKSYEQVFSEFTGSPFDDQYGLTGDVKYHLGYSNDVDVEGHNVHLALAFNPSHLEAVDPVVEGMARAKQEHRYQANPQRLVPLLIHGDAAVIGQGVVTETLNFSGLEGYSTGGTLHVVINNQVGFTASPNETRSTLYCTDFAKAIQAPVFHVNGDDVEAVVHALALAAEFRMKFHRDVFVDVVSYRKYGHNEGDEPRFTQPLMYAQIAKQKKTVDLYNEKLAKEKVIDGQWFKEQIETYEQQLESELQSAKDNLEKLQIEAFNSDWADIEQASIDDMLQPFSSGAKKSDIDKVLELIHTVPEELNPLPKFSKMLQSRYEKIQKEKIVDWATAEQLAFGTLLLEGYSVRLSGQDSIRGTFSQRHVEMTDAKTGKAYRPLAQLNQGKSQFMVYNSPLSEFGVVGFEFGYASAAPYTLTMWEGQFGDFANGAQIIIDQFLTSSEQKWYRVNSLVLLLPHGFEGQGPEHSSARLERFLQMAAEGNYQVTYPTTPAQYFHLLRRQLQRAFRKPLIVMTPKSPLRMPEVASPLEQLESGGFENLLLTGASQAKRVVFCTGKVYWDLAKAAKEKGLDKETLLVRVEQLYPLDLKAIEKIWKDHKGAKDWVWAQEEPQNMGAWSYFRMATLDMELPLRYAGRRPYASIATGSPQHHIEEQQQIIKDTFQL